MICELLRVYDVTLDCFCSVNAEEISLVVFFNFYHNFDTLETIHFNTTLFPNIDNIIFRREYSTKRNNMAYVKLWLSVALAISLASSTSSESISKCSATNSTVCSYESGHALSCCPVRNGVCCANKEFCCPIGIQMFLFNKSSSSWLKQQQQHLTRIRVWRSEQSMPEGRCLHAVSFEDEKHEKNDSSSRTSSKASYLCGQQYIMWCFADMLSGFWQQIRLLPYC